MPKKKLYFYLVIWPLLTVSPAFAQVIPDRTLPINSSVLAGENGALAIVGGTRKEGNLFHSFEKFSIPAGITAVFNNDASVVNIFTRVTGGDVSLVNGTLSVNGRANLFLINPAGIIFGPGASLVLGGSFVATTGESVLFQNGKYDARSPDSSVLSVSLPVGIKVDRPGPIVVRGDGHNFYREPVIGAVVPSSIDTGGLRVSPGRTIALVGGPIELEGGKLGATGGNIYLGAVGTGIVTLEPGRDFKPAYGDVERFQNISLVEQALLDNSGFGGGEIGLRGENLYMTDSSLIINSNYGRVDSGPIELKFQGDAIIIGSTARNSSNTPDRPIGRGISSQGFGGGDSANISIGARSLILKDNAGVGSQNAGNGKGGNLFFNVGKLDVLGKSDHDIFPVGSIISAGTIGEGEGGSIEILAGELNIRDGGVISSTNLGIGRGGDVRVVSEFTNIGGSALPSANSLTSGIGTFAGNRGRAGDVTLETRRLNLIDGGILSARTVGPGDGGILTVKAGEINLIAGDGRQSAITSSATLPGSLLTEEVRIPNIGRELIGNAGSVYIETGELTLSGASAITVINDGSGTAGNISVNADRVLLDRSARISANSRARDGGNISLRSRFLGLFGGSDITADAVSGRGGNIAIDTGVFFLSPDSRISASSGLGVRGTININTRDFQIAPSWVKFPDNTAMESVTASSCLGGDGRYRFTVTGSGGTAVSPGGYPVPYRVYPSGSEEAIDLKIEGGRVFLVGCDRSFGSADFGSGENRVVN